MANIKRNSPKKIVSSKVKKPSSTNISITVPQGTGTSNSTCGDNLDDVFVSDGGLPDIPEESDDISISSCDQDVAKGFILFCSFLLLYACIFSTTKNFNGPMQPVSKQDHTKPFK